LSADADRVSVYAVPTQGRVEQNEKLFREVNERIAEVTERVQDVVDSDADFYCECASKGCLERIRITVDEYQQVRAHDRHFFVVPGHELPAHERVVRREEAYLVVEKPAA
jgi:hypothetical protein